MKILCATSGIQFTCEHIPASMQSREVSHPIFALKQTKLLGLYAKWTQGALTDTDSYLLYLAMLNSTDLVRWTVPAQKTSLSTSIASNNLPRLVEIINRMSGIPATYADTFANIAVTPENCDLSTSHIWLDIWIENLRDYHDGYKSVTVARKIAQREDVLQKLIKDSSKTASNYARLLAKWAAESGNFPQFQVLSPISDKNVTLSEYWQEIIIACCKQEAIFKIPKADLDELIDHCTDNIQPGTIYQHALSVLLREGGKNQHNYLGLGDMDITGNPYRILDAKDSIEDANKLAMIDSAPENLPIESNYPNKIAYLRAKAKWDMKLAYAAQQNGAHKS